MKFTIDSLGFGTKRPEYDFNWKKIRFRKGDASYYNLDLPSVCLFHISSAVYRPIGTKLGRNIADALFRATSKCCPAVRMRR